MCRDVTGRTGFASTWLLIMTSLDREDDTDSKKPNIIEHLMEDEALNTRRVFTSRLEKQNSE
jgi:hypothetical protein